MRLLAGTVFDRPPRCERCDELEENCRCTPPDPVRTAPRQQTLVLAVEKRKRGKIVTVIKGVAADNDPAALLTKLKTVCGAGGTLSDGVLEVQGSHLDRIRDTLQSLGYRCKG
jgi:translation initiation factor 1